MSKATQRRPFPPGPLLQEPAGVYELGADCDWANSPGVVPDRVMDPPNQESTVSLELPNPLSPPLPSPRCPALCRMLNNAPATKLPEDCLFVGPGDLAPHRFYHSAISDDRSDSLHPPVDDNCGDHSRHFLAAGRSASAPSTGNSLTGSWIKHLRNVDSTLICHLCQRRIGAAPTVDTFRAHVLDNADRHEGLDNDAAIQSAFQKLVSEKNCIKRAPNFEYDDAVNKRSRKRPSGGEDSSSTEHTLCPDSTKVSVARSRARNPYDKSVRYPGSPRPTRMLYDPKNDSTQAETEAKQRRNLFRPRLDAQRAQSTASPPLPPNTPLAPQPETKPISHEQLVAEVKGIYAGLVMIETKCIEVDNAQSASTENKLNKDQWQALIALHRTLLHEHHDFFLASQHPAANPALRRLASKYAMPARMWRHGIHSFLELLRRRLPDSYEHMLTFIYLAYSMMALLYETVPNFEDTWLECLGDLARYRQAIEDDDLKDRETWTGVARQWYSTASEKTPSTGRLYHHLAILARPHAVQQLYFYTKSLCVEVPFSSARESIMTLFDPILNSGQASRLPAIDAAFVRVHGRFFSKQHTDAPLDEVMEEYLGLFDAQIGHRSRKWLLDGYYIGCALACPLLEYGPDPSQLLQPLPRGADDANPVSRFVHAPIPDEDYFLRARLEAYAVAISHCGDPSVLPFLYTAFVYIYYVARFPSVIRSLEQMFPWKLVKMMLSHMVMKDGLDQATSSFDPVMKDGFPRPLPEDVSMRGLTYSHLGLNPIRKTILLRQTCKRIGGAFVNGIALAVSECMIIAGLYMVFYHSVLRSLLSRGASVAMVSAKEGYRAGAPLYWRHGKMPRTQAPVLFSFL